MQGQYWVFSNVMVCLPTSSVYFQTEADGKGQTFRSVGDTCAQLILYKTYPSSVFRELFFVRQLWLHHYSLCFHLCNLITYLLVSCKNPSLSKPFNLLISFHIRCHIMPFPSSTVHHNCNKHVEINRKLFFPQMFIHLIQVLFITAGMPNPFHVCWWWGGPLAAALIHSSGD